MRNENKEPWIFFCIFDHESLNLLDEITFNSQHIVNSDYFLYTLYTLCYRMLYICIIWFSICFNICTIVHVSAAKLVFLLSVVIRFTWYHQLIFFSWYATISDRFLHKNALLANTRSCFFFLLVVAEFFVCFCMFFGLLCQFFYLPLFNVLQFH